MKSKVLAMPDIKLTSGTVEWYTPSSICEMSREVLHGIDLDPASCAEANELVKAKRYLTEADDGLMHPWLKGEIGISVFVNPPGGVREDPEAQGKKPTSQPLLFWRQLMVYRELNKIDHAIFFAFSAELLQVSQGRDYPSLAKFPFCAPAKRIRCMAPGGKLGSAPVRSSLIVYVPGRIDETSRFVQVFSTLGDVLLPAKKP